MVPDLMLATPTTLPVDVASATLTATGLWAAEVKLDGLRAAVTLEGEKVTITNRNGVNITARFPDVAEALKRLEFAAVLDGEIIVKDRQGRPDFAAVHGRNAQATPRAIAALIHKLPATFVAFDVLFISGIDMRRLPYTRRRERLEWLGRGGPLEINPSYDDGQVMWEFVVDHELEGLVLKRKDSPYVGGQRSKAWVKVKAFKRISAVVYGWEPGKGHLTGTFGALKLALVDEGQLREVGSVGTGFTAADRRLIWERLQRGGQDPIILDVNYLEVSPSGQLRQPSFQGVRSDIPITDCTVSQLKGDAS